MMLMSILMLTSCQTDEQIDTSRFGGNWFATQIEMTNAASLDDLTYQTTNSRSYKETTLTDGCLMLMVSETSNFNEYNVRLYKYTGGKWAVQHQQSIKLSGDNKFTFYGRECKLKQSRENSMEVKASYDGDIYRYSLSRTVLAP